jgi:hypothetical protein
VTECKIVAGSIGYGIHRDCGGFRSRLSLASRGVVEDESFADRNLGQLRHCQRRHTTHMTANLPTFEFLIKLLWPQEKKSSRMSGMSTRRSRKAGKATVTMMVTVSVKDFFRPSRPYVIGLALPLTSGGFDTPPRHVIAFLFLPRTSAVMMMLPAPMLFFRLHS